MAAGAVTSSGVFTPPNPLIFQETMTIPANAGPRAYAQSMDANSAGAPMTTHAYGDWPENGVIQKGYVMRPWGEKFSTTLIKQGQLIFVRRGNSVDRGDKQASDDAQEFTLLNLGQLNILLRDLYDEASQAFAGVIDRGRGLGEADANRLLRCTELAHDPLYVEYFEDAFGTDQGSTYKDRLHKSQFRFYMHQFSQAGVRQHWSWLGTSILSSAPDTQAHGVLPYFPMNICYKGPQDLQNVYGEVAGSGSEFHLIWKRRELANGDYGAFAAVPYSTGSLRYVPCEVRQYLDAGAGAQYGGIEFVGLSQDSLGGCPSLSQLAYATGLAHDASADSEAQASSKLPVVDTTVYRNWRNRWLYAPF
jgi:hypothetical protein